MIKRIAFFLYVILAGYIFINATNKTAGGHPTSTGAPGEQTCARSGCHTDAAINKDSPLNKFIFSNPQNTYNPGGYYSITIEINLADIKKFGFELVAIDSATQKNAGKWLITDPDRTHVISGEAPVPDRNYVTHTAEGTSPVSAGKGQWKLKWQAPSGNIGTIVFYIVCSATNNNDQSTGEKLFFSNHKVRYDPNSIGILNPAGSKPGLKIGKDKIYLAAENYNIKAIKISTLEGKMIYEKNAPQNNHAIDKYELKTDASLIYVFQILTDKGNFYGKFRI